MNLNSQTKDNIYKTKEFKIQYPYEWKLDTSRQMGSFLFVFSELTDTTDKFSENINIYVQDLKNQNLDLDLYKSITENQLKTIAKELEIESSLIVETKNGDLIYDLKYKMLQGILKLKLHSKSMIKNGKVYLFSFVCEEKNYAKYNAKGEEILNSIVVFQQNTILALHNYPYLYSYSEYLSKIKS